MTCFITACINYDSDFTKTCVEVFNGTKDGGRCFFLGNVTSTWNDSWLVCQQYGAVLAQVHTESEFSKISQYIGVSCNTYSSKHTIRCESQYGELQRYYS